MSSCSGPNGEALGKLLEERVGGSDGPGDVREATPEAALLVCCEGAGSEGPEELLRTADTLESVGKADLGGAQGRNRTADTGIFSRPVGEPEPTRNDSGNSLPVGERAPLMRCGAAVAEALAAIHGARRVPLANASPFEASP
jgi:hypothetical protein